MNEPNYITDENPDPKPGLCVAVDHLPGCDICQRATARFDAASTQGPWAYMCAECFRTESVAAVHHRGLGMGIGQRLVQR